MKEAGWNTSAYDPYSNPIRPKGLYNFITAIEVFEHSTDIAETIKDIKSFLTKDGVILFTTLLAEKNTDIDWWYILPRNGHISILSKESMKILAIKNGMFFETINEGTHVLQYMRNTAKNLLGIETVR
jgi:2-polyprenyl-3-methyl-5-hydroxy-6-metoxy-1,4-benzoquinol methylase